ncbi:MAG: PorT family protein [Rikenellaceae bacterium]|nr:PorT family protein [Rikenellaceae bacterium]
MKKLLLSVIGLCMMGFAAQAQTWSFGPKAGMSFATVNGVDHARVRTGFVAGMFAERRLKNVMAWQAELLFTSQGYFTKFDGNPKTVYRLNYLSMPIVSKYYLMGGLNLQLGGQFNYLVSAKQDVKHGGGKTDIKSNINKFDVSFLTGLAYDFDCGLIIEGRYTIGLTRLLRTSDHSVTTGSLQVAVGWRF